jgi:acyl dehydratase
MSPASLVTDAHRALVGQRGPRIVAEFPITGESIRRFTQALMQPNPIHWDAKASQAAGFEDVVAPPLYVMHAIRRRSAASDPLDELAEHPDWDGADADTIGGLPELVFPLARVLNGGTAAEFFQCPKVGDIVSARSMYTDIAERQGRSGPMVVVTIETEYHNQADELLARVRMTILRR